MKSNDTHEVVKDWYFKDVSNKLSSQTSRVIDPIYNDKDAPLQIHTFGDSWTYGDGVEQTETFTHLLGDENTAVHNYGAGGTGLDFAVKTLSEVYIPESRRQIFIITVPHYFRRTWFDDDGVIYKPWELKEFVDFNEYNNYFYFLYQYDNKLINNMYAFIRQLV